MSFFNKLYDIVISKISHPQAERYLYGLSFCESSFFPIPPDVMLAPMCAVTPQHALRFAWWTTIFSVIGGYFGYLIGFFLFETIQPWLLQTHYWERYQEAKALFTEWGGWAVFVAALTPIPYKVITVGAGALEQNLIVFGIASLLGRGGRFMLVAIILRWCGPKVLPYVEKWAQPIGWAVVILLALALVWLYWI